VRARACSLLIHRFSWLQSTGSLRFRELLDGRTVCSWYWYISSTIVDRKNRQDSGVVKILEVWGPRIHQRDVINHLVQLERLPVRYCYNCKSWNTVRLAIQSCCSHERIFGRYPTALLSKCQAIDRTKQRLVTLVWSIIVKRKRGRRYIAKLVLIATTFWDISRRGDTREKKKESRIVTFHSLFFYA